jgi:hypothetical protein
MRPVFLKLNEPQIVFAAHGGESVSSSLSAVEGLDGCDGLSMVGEAGAYLLDVV